MCLFPFPFNTSTTRRKDSSSSSHFFKSNKDKPQGPITRKKGLRQPPRPPPPPPPTPEPTPKGRKLSPRRGKRGNVPVPLGETNCARRRHSGSPARSSGGARSSSREHHNNKGDQAKAQTQTQPQTWPPSRLTGSDVLYPSSASGAYHKGAGIQVQDFQHESQPHDSGDGFHTDGFIQPVGHAWTWLKGGEGSYILVVITQLEMGGFDLS